MSGWKRARECVLGERVSAGRESKRCWVGPKLNPRGEFPGSTPTLLSESSRHHQSSLRLDTHLAPSTLLPKLLDPAPLHFCPLGSYLAIWTNCPLHSTTTSAPQFNHTNHSEKIGDGRDFWGNCIQWVKTLFLLQKMTKIGSVQLHMCQCSGSNTDVPIFAFLS